MPVRVLQVLLVVLTTVYLVGSLPGVRPRPGFVPELDGWVHFAMLGTGILVIGLRPVLLPRARLFWSLLTASLAVRAVGFAIYVYAVRPLDPAPMPSWADAAWVSSSLLLIAALVVLANGRTSRPAVPVALDAVTGALVVAAAVAVFVYDPLVRLLPGDAGLVDLLVNLAYPVLDAAALVILVWVMASLRWRVAGPLRWLGAAVVGYTIVDVAFVYLAATNTFVSGSLLSGLAGVSAAVFAGAAWSRAATVGWEPIENAPGVLLPATFATVSWALLVYVALRPVGAAGVVLAAAAAGVALLRTVLGFQQGRALVEQRRLARTDDLTGLANRRGLLEALHDGDHDRPTALLLLDVDDFRRLNEEFGTAHGDFALLAVGRRLREAVGDGDVVARLEADTFAVVVRGEDADTAESTADRLRASIRRPVDVGGQLHVIGASVGQAMAPDDARDGAALLRRAESALADAKLRGVGHTRYDGNRHVSGDERERRTDDVQRALRGGELFLHYQPQVALDTGRIVGFEALVRWQHPEHGLLLPGHFLPAIESAGLVRDLFSTVLQQACAQAARWKAQGHDLVVALNVTVADLLDPILADQVADALTVAGLEGRHCTLELTEEVFLAEPRRAMRAVEELRARGVGLLIDDFGTGYSSLSYLKDLRGLSGLKIDRGFIGDLAHDLRLQAIVASTLQLAGSLGLEVIAEGIESEEARRWLVANGCAFGQGYAFSPPVDPAEVPLGQVFAPSVCTG